MAILFTRARFGVFLRVPTGRAYGTPRQTACACSSVRRFVMNCLGERKGRSCFAVFVQNLWLNVALTIDRKGEPLIQVFLTKSSMCMW